MRRRNFISIVLVALIAGAVVYFAACKKDIVTPIINSEYTPEARQVVGRIKKFKSQLIDKENVARDGLHVPIDSVIWNVEALFNSEYTFPDRKYLETVKHDIQFLVTVNENDEVAFNDVADLYDEITETVRQVYATDGIEQDKSLMAVVVERGDIIGDKAQIDVHVVSGRVETNTMLKNPVGGPFKPGDCWYYGEYGGSCDDPTLLMDAAEIIEDTINYYYSQISVPQGGFRYLNHGMFIRQGNQQQRLQLRLMRLQCLLMMSLFLLVSRLFLLLA